jgi:GntR family transcriptional regulator/MocR family aminotransferase
LKRHARKVRQVYLKRRDAFAETLAETLGDRVDYAVPDGGLAFWLKFRDPAILDRIETRAPDLGLRFALSSSFMTRPEADRGLRFGFASLTPHEARQALNTLRSLTE